MNSTFPIRGKVCILPWGCAKKRLEQLTGELEGREARAYTGQVVSTPRRGQVRNRRQDCHRENAKRVGRKLGANPGCLFNGVRWRGW